MDMCPKFSFFKLYPYCDSSLLYVKNLELILFGFIEASRASSLLGEVSQRDQSAFMMVMQADYHEKRHLRWNFQVHASAFG